MTQIWKPLEQLWEEKDPRAETARIILAELEEYALTGQVYPNQQGFYHYLHEPQWNKTTKQFDPAKYPDLKVGSYDYWFRRLREAGYIFIDRRSGSRSIGCVRLAIVKKGVEVTPHPTRPEPEF